EHYHCSVFFNGVIFNAAALTFIAGARKDAWAYFAEPVRGIFFVVNHLFLRRAIPCFVLLRPCGACTASPEMGSMVIMGIVFYFISESAGFFSFLQRFL